MRSSALLSVGKTQILIDAGPEFRLQALRGKITSLSAVLLTHAHADHIAGLDDLRAFYFLTQKKLPCFLSEETLREVEQRFPYFFKGIIEKQSVPAQLAFQRLEGERGTFSIEGVPFSYFSYAQAGMKVTGFRYQNVAYVSDIRDYGEAVFDALDGVDTLVLSALRHTASPLHLSISEAAAFARKVGATRTFLTHLSHELDHEKTNAELPADVQLGYDGLEISL
jgi:phosphoribosyl 1,2-cyclic phosphate phosphodiesterase